MHLSDFLCGYAYPRPPWATPPRFLGPSSARPTKALLKEKGKGTARDNINLGTFENQRFPFPPLKLQKDIVATLCSLREETQRLATVYQRKLTALEALKKSLLHQAFTGQLGEQAA